MLKRKPIYWVGGLSLVSRSHYLTCYSRVFRLVACGKNHFIHFIMSFFWRSNIYLKLHAKIRALCLFNKLHKAWIIPLFKFYCS